MPKKIRATLRIALFSNFHTGKVTLASILIGAVITVTSFGVFFEVKVPKAQATTTVQTLVTVLNTPPVWTIDAQEEHESSTSTPTNAGSILRWYGTGTDSSNDPYYLLICKTSGTPFASSTTTPSCGGGVTNQWAVSALTASAASAVAATTTKETFPFNLESNPWFAWICDNNNTGAACNLVYKQGSGTTVSPFVINHPPSFSVVANNSPTDPGGSITWTTTASDTDVIRGIDQVRLFVCKASDFVASTSACGVGGTWATSTPFNTNPSTTTPIVIPTPDKTYNAFVYVTDSNNLEATSTFEASNSSFVVRNVAPTVSSSTISLVDQVDGGDITLFRPQSTSGPFAVQFTVTDNNSCQNASSGNEIASTTVNVYRSGIGMAGCQLPGDHNANNCYPMAYASTTMFTCTQDGASCSGVTDSTATWTCTFALWYNADPTDTGAFYAAENWLASVQAHDDNATSSPLTQAQTGNEVDSFLAFGVTQTAISYGGLQPGFANDPLATTTDLRELGNVGLDEGLYGDTMCTNWTAADSCDAGGIDPTREIPVSNQKFATSSVSYASGYTLTSSTSPSTLLIHVLKTTASTSPQTKDTYWGINIPVAITVAGAYTGQNTITAVKSSSAFW